MQDQPWELLPCWLNSIQASEWKNRITYNLRWEQPLIRVYSRSYYVPRLTSFIANKNISYVYSGFKHIGEGWPVWIMPLLEKVNHACKTSFNGCLINLYRDGNDKMGWHSDDEKELDKEKPIASLSLGISRDFVLKHRRKILRKSLLLSNGDLLIMYPQCQKDWLHSLPARKKIKEHRINLTFRCYL